MVQNDICSKTQYIFQKHSYKIKKMFIKYIRVIDYEEGMEVSNGDKRVYIDMNKFERDFVMEVIKSMTWN